MDLKKKIHKVPDFSKNRFSPIIYAVLSSAAFGFGPIAVRYLHKIADLDTFAASVKITTVYFLSVYSIVWLLSYAKRTLHFSISKLWGRLSLKTKTYLVGVGISNAISGWCFFAMLGKIDPLSGSIIMSLAIVLNFILSKFVLGEAISFKSPQGRKKWGGSALVIAGALTAAVYSYFSTIAQTEITQVTLGILSIAFLSSMFAAVRTVSVKKVISDYREAFQKQDSDFDLPLSVTRASYFFAFLFTLIAGGIWCLINPTLNFSINNIVLLHPFVIILGLIYGAAYSLRYIAMSNIEASQMAIIGRLASVFTGSYMFIAGVLGIGGYPSWIQAPAAILVILGSYLATKVEKKRLKL